MDILYKIVNYLSNCVNVKTTLPILYELEEEQ